MNSRGWAPLVVAALREGIEHVTTSSQIPGGLDVDAVLDEDALAAHGRALACLSLLTSCTERVRAGSLVRMEAWPGYMSSGHGRVISYQEGKDTVNLANFQVDDDNEAEARRRLASPTQNEVPMMRVMAVPQQSLSHAHIPLDLWQSVFNAAS